jgi:cysteine desulfurase
MSLGAPVYLDYQATTPLDPRVLEAMLPWLQGVHGNPHSSEHAFGWRAAAAIEASKESIAEFIGAEPREVIFTSSASEANNLAIHQALARGHGRDTLIVSATEHPSILEAAQALTSRGIKVMSCKVDEGGALRMEHLRELLSPRVALVSVAAVNNEVGTIQDIKTIAAVAHTVGALAHSDCSQAPLALTVDVAEWGLDLATFSSHKAYGPVGIGSLFVATPALSALRPLIVGGSQQAGLRAGTLSTALCVGFAAALRLVREGGELERARVRALRDRLRERLLTEVRGSRLVGQSSPRHPGNVSVSLPIVDARDIVQRVQPRIAIATGSACRGGSEEPSHVLRALGMSESEARRVVRIGFGRFSIEDEIEMAVSEISAAVTANQQAYADETKGRALAAS